MKKVNSFLSSFLMMGAFAMAGGLSLIETNNVLRAEASDGYVNTSLGDIHDGSNEYYSFTEGTKYNVGNGSVVKMRGYKGGANETPKIRRKGTSPNYNYYIYLKYNSSHSEIGQLGTELYFDAEDGYLLDSFSLFNGYQVKDAFSVYYYDRTTSSYVLDENGTAQMFSAANATFDFTLQHSTKSIKIVHYLLSPEQYNYNYVAWMESRIYYSAAKTLTFDSQGGTSVEEERFLSTDTQSPTFEPADPVRASTLTISYEFKGWYNTPACEEGDEFVFGNVLDSSKTVYAKWEEHEITSYQMTFNTMGGSAIDPTFAAPGDPFVQPASNPTIASDTKYNYTFKNWYADENLTTVYDFSTPASSNVTVYAGYEYAQNTLEGVTSIGVKQNIMTYGASWSSSAYNEYDLPSQSVNASMVDSVFEIRAFANGGGLKRVGSGKYDVYIRNAIVTWQLNDYSKYIKTVRWDIKNTHYKYNDAQIVYMYTGRNATGTLVDSDHLSPYSGGADRCVQMLNNTDGTINAVSFKNNPSYTFDYGYETIRYELANASDAQQAKFFAEAFIREFTCDGNGSITNDTWSTFSTRISTMSEQALLLLKEAAHDDTDLGAAVERYDYVIAKYGTSGHADFLHRTDEGGAYSNQFDLFAGQRAIATANNIAIVIAVSLVTIIGVGILFFSKKRINKNK